MSTGDGSYYCSNCDKWFHGYSGHSCVGYRIEQTQPYYYQTFPQYIDPTVLERIANSLEEIIVLLKNKDK